MEMVELKSVLPEADKNLFLQFREGQLTLDQLKTRVNFKMGRANYKCLDDLLQQGLDPNVKRNPEETELYLNTIHRKERLDQVSTKDIMTREPWQANDRCLKSIFSKIPDTKALRKM
jgi:hypothetical protein